LQEIAALRQKRNEIITQARGMLDKADAEKRGLTAEETGTYDKMITDQDELRTKIEREERMLDLERDLAGKEGQRIADPAGKENGKEGRKLGITETPEYFDMAMRFLQSGTRGVTADEYRALSAGSSVDGGYIVAPMQMVDSLIKFLDNDVLIRAKATKFRLARSLSLGAPSLDTDISDADWTSELLTGSEDSSMKFGRRELTPHPLAKRIKISNKLLVSSVMDVEAIVRARMGYKFGIVQENAFLNGSGNQQPLGVFTASALGISTGRDVSTGNTATEMTFDGLIEAKYSLKGQYQRTAEWIFHRDGVKQIAKIKDGDGQYIWQPAKTAGDPDMLLGRPVSMSEYAPNTFTTGLYTGIFGDFSHYWIADAMDMQIQVLKELYAETNQTGYIGRLETDGMPVLEEAFARVKLG